jgi:peptidoglycan hydrolase CwlO-like protein
MPFSLRAALRVLVVVLAVGIVSMPAISSANRAEDDPARERERVRAQRAQVASQVDALRATDAEIEQALISLNANVRGQEALHADAVRAAAEAQEAHEAAVAAVEAKTAEIEVLREQIREFAVEAFIRPPSDDALTALDADSPSDAAEKKALLELQSEYDGDLLDRLTAAEEDLEVHRQAAQEAAQLAADKQAEVEGRLAEVTRARDQQAAFAVEVQSRLNRSLAEAAALEDLDRELSDQIRRQQEALARQRALEEALEAQRRAAETAARPTSTGGQVSAGPGSLSSVSCPNGGSITVASSIAGNLSSLLRAAAADGIILCGGGYRSSQRQAELRQINGCPDTHSAPSSSCRVPTAPPGNSMHERGLAVDFTCNGGGAIGSRSSPCFQWLSANASSYGFYNLPSEPWHWSTNGQ